MVSVEASCDFDLKFSASFLRVSLPSFNSTMQFDQLSSEGGSAPASPSTRLEKWRNLSQDLDAFVSGLLADRSSSLTDSKKKGGDGRSFIVVIVQGVVGVRTGNRAVGRGKLTERLH